MSISDRLQVVRQRSGTATIVAVSKKQPVSLIREALSAGIRDFGENFAQELRDKAREIEGVRWHFIGRLQRNKVKYVVGTADLIHSVDSLKIAQAIDEHAQKLGIRQDVLLAVNIAREDSKSGVLPDRLHSIVEEVRGLDGVRVRGLMAMPPLVSDPEENRHWFRGMSALAERYDFSYLSMGTSVDYAVAAEEGATHVRVGTALLGTRPVS